MDQSSKIKELLEINEGLTQSDVTAWKACRLTKAKPNVFTFDFITITSI